MIQSRDAIRLSCAILGLTQMAAGTYATGSMLFSVSAVLRGYRFSVHMNSIFWPLFTIGMGIAMIRFGGFIADRITRPDESFVIDVNRKVLARAFSFVVRLVGLIFLLRILPTLFEQALGVVGSYAQGSEWFPSRLGELAGSILVAISAVYCLRGAPMLMRWSRLQETGEVA